MVSLMQSVNVDEDWKLITLWIGGNDLCRYCNDKVSRKIFVM